LAFSGWVVTPFTAVFGLGFYKLVNFIFIWKKETDALDCTARSDRKIHNINWKQKFQIYYLSRQQGEQEARNLHLLEVKVGLFDIKCMTVWYFFCWKSMKDSNWSFFKCSCGGFFFCF
jgi:hypothetical protein